MRVHFQQRREVPRHVRAHSAVAADEVRHPAQRRAAGEREQLGEEGARRPAEPGLHVERRRGGCGRTREEIVRQPDEPVHGLGVELLGDGLQLRLPGFDLRVRRSLRAVEGTAARARQLAQQLCGEGRDGAEELTEAFLEAARQPLLLGGEQHAEVGHRSFGGGERLLQGREPALRLVQRPLKRGAPLLQLVQQETAEPLHAAPLRRNDESSAGVFGEVRQRALELRPVARRGLGRADLEERSDRAREPRCEHPLRERGALPALVGGESIGLVEHADEQRDVLRHLLDQRQLVPGDRRVRAEHDQRRVDVRHEGARRLRVPAEHRSDPRRIDEAQPAAQDRARQHDLDDADPLLVARVALLGHVVCELLRGDLDHSPVEQADERPPDGAVPDHGDDGGDGNDSDRKDRLPEQRVEEGGLAALELADAGHEEAALRRSLLERARLRGDGPGVPLGGERSKPAERSVLRGFVRSHGLLLQSEYGFCPSNEGAA